MPSANDRTAKTDSLHTIYLAGGCFWGLEAFLKQLPGVRGTEVGYANGATFNRTYAEVCHRGTGHAEPVKVTYDPQVLPTDVLLRGFFSVIDPTSVNRQGNDVGAQYRSGVYWTTPPTRRSYAPRWPSSRRPIVGLWSRRPGRSGGSIPPKTTTRTTSTRTPGATATFGRARRGPSWSRAALWRGARTAGVAHIPSATHLPAAPSSVRP